MSIEEEMSKIRVLGAFDKFKDTLGAEEVTKSVFRGLEKVFPNRIQTTAVTLSDGGDGFLLSLLKPYNLTLKSSTVTGPLGNKVEAEYGINPQSKIAVVEMAKASGLEKVPLEHRNPLNTTTKGTGELIKEIYNAGYRRILLGVGGSATNDAGFGALQAMGMKITIKEDNNIYEPETFYGKHLPLVHEISIPKESLLPECSIEIACDVDSPFVGPKGATYTFSGQKGASEEDKKYLEAGMVHVAKLLHKATGVDVSNIPGAGAAGGISGGFIAAVGAKLRKGSQFIAEAHGLEEKIKNSDLVLTGEGSYDATTETGKVVYQVVQMARKNNVPVVVICGRQKDITDKSVRVYDLLSMFPVEKAMKETAKCLEELVVQKATSFPVLEKLKSSL